jgi:hypothetical protein
VQRPLLADEDRAVGAQRHDGHATALRAQGGTGRGSLSGVRHRQVGHRRRLVLVHDEEVDRPDQLRPQLDRGSGVEDGAGAGRLGALQRLLHRVHGDLQLRQHHPGRIDPDPVVVDVGRADDPVRAGHHDDVVLAVVGDRDQRTAGQRAHP